MVASDALLCCHGNIRVSESLIQLWYSHKFSQFLKQDLHKDTTGKTEGEGETTHSHGQGKKIHIPIPFVAIEGHLCSDRHTENHLSRMRSISP